MEPKRNLNENYAKLGIAIVQQACKDAKAYPREVRDFFCGDNSVFAFCMPHTDGKALLDQVYKNFEKYDYYMPPAEKTKLKEELNGIDDYDEDYEEDYEEDNVWVS